MINEIDRTINVQKFGGTSVDSLERFRQSCLVVERGSKDGMGTVAVISAMSGVTNRLIAAGNAAVNGDLDLSNTLIDQIQEQHLAVIDKLEKSELSQQARMKIIEVIGDTRKLLRSINIFGELTPRANDIVQSVGERMSPYIFAACLDEMGIPVSLLDAGLVIKTNDSFGDAYPNSDLVVSRVNELVSPEIEQGKIVVMGGFYGTTPSGVITTLGRGGSDFSATILGSALHNLGYNLNTVYLNKADVAGVLTAHPGIVENALIIPHLSRYEAGAATMLGTSVIHPRAIQALPSDIPIIVRSTLEPDKQGTLIDSEAYDYGLPVKLITILPQLKLLSLSGPGMDRPGIAEFVFGELGRNNINVRAISQPPTEGVLRIVIPPDAQIDPVIAHLNTSFTRNMKVRDIATIDVEDVSLVGIVGDRVGKPDVLEKVFKVLRNENDLFNGNNGNSKSGGVIFIGPGDYQYSLFLRNDKGGERAKSIVRKFHEVLIVDRYKS